MISLARIKIDGAATILHQKPSPNLKQVLHSGTVAPLTHRCSYSQVQPMAAVARVPLVLSITCPASILISLANLAH